MAAELTFQRLDTGEAFTLSGRPAQTLAELIRRGAAGATSGEFSPLGWARRTSHYVFELRAMGLDIETRFEAAGDARVGRYVLATPVFVLGKPSNGGAVR
jgi:hypothetical protein